MTLLDVKRLTDHWKRSPPLRVIVAACAASLGVDLSLLNVQQDTKRYLSSEDFQRSLGILNASLAKGPVDG